jgi:hypothetical protein
MKMFSCKKLIERSIIIAYVTNPWLTKKKFQANISCFYASNTNTYAEVHKDDNDLIAAFKLILEPPIPPLKAKLTQISHNLLYRFEAFKRRITPVPPTLTRSKPEDLEQLQRLLENDRKQVKHWDEIQAKTEQRRKEWCVQEKARRATQPKETSLLYKPDNYKFKTH